MVFSKLQRSKLLPAARALFASAVLGAMFRSWLKKRPKKSKAASIKLTLAAVGLDAYELLRSCTSGFVHNKERRVDRAHPLEVGAPGRAADDINR
jgi:hypothetical protein